jgi:hypothetical protein
VGGAGDAVPEMEAPVVGATGLRELELQPAANASANASVATHRFSM